MTDVHVMIDIETLASTADALILSIGAYMFEPATDKCTPITHGGFYTVCSQASQPDRVIAVNTVRWWEQQSDEARKVLMQSTAPEAPTLAQALTALAEWMPAEYAGVWSNGADFDLPIIGHAVERLKLPRPWSFRKHRCYRTIRNISGFDYRGLPRRDGTHHNAMDDAQYQAECASVILGRLHNMTDFWE